MRGASAALCSPVPSTTDHKPILTKYPATPFLILPTWRTTLTQPAPCVQRIARLTAQSPTSPVHFPVQHLMAVPSVRVNFLPAFNSRTSRYTKIYNVRQSNTHFLPRRNLTSPIPIWTRGPSPPPCIPEEDEYEGDSQSKGALNEPTPSSPKTVDSNRTPTLNRKSSSEQTTRILITGPPNEQPHSSSALSSRGVYWPETSVPATEHGLYEHHLDILQTVESTWLSGSNGIGLYKNKEVYDNYWFGSGSDLLLIPPSAHNPKSPVNGNVDMYNMFYEYPPVVMYSGNKQLPVSTYVSGEHSCFGKLLWLTVSVPTEMSLVHKHVRTMAQAIVISHFRFSITLIFRQPKV
ncbi:unnamed protein product [Echinostoma caproni]|uniref:DPPIV_N domain-containing protein n=1 Tax=Echinostoma caproni TaxID=27848 RepID=A0A183ASL2_9TREM|nr:unnamed protein product [Echinostoma caproni]